MQYEYRVQDGGGGYVCARVVQRCQCTPPGTWLCFCNAGCCITRHCHGGMLHARVIPWCNTQDPSPHAMRPRCSRTHAVIDDMIRFVSQLAPHPLTHTTPLTPHNTAPTHWNAPERKAVSVSYSSPSAMAVGMVFMIMCTHTRDSS